MKLKPNYQKGPRFTRGRHRGEDQEAWWYADRGGIDVLCEASGQGPTSVRLTWRLIRKAMEAKDRSK
jgi:hypothetical protein